MLYKLFGINVTRLISHKTVDIHTRVVGICKRAPGCFLRPIPEGGGLL